MSEDRGHVDDRLDDWLDGRLTESGRLAFEQHVSTCERCSRRRDALVIVRQSVQALRSEAQPPAELVERISRALERADAELPSAPDTPETSRPRRAVPGARLSRLAFAAVLLLVLGVAVGTLLVNTLRGPENLAHAALAQHRELSDRPLRPRLAASSAAVVEERWRLAGLDFPARVLDLQGMGIVLEGGDVTELAGRRAARTVYRFEGRSDRLLCAMFAGEDGELPPADEVVADQGFGGEGFVFHIYRAGDRTAIFWAEGEVLCVLVGTGDSREILELARAKAMAPPPRV